MIVHPASTFARASRATQAGVLPALALWLACALPALAQAQPLKPCRIEGAPHELQCGELRRPLDPTRPQGPQITLRYVVAPAMARRKLSDPVFLLAGGPGQSATSLIPHMLPLLARLNNRRDLVFVDQRGTGGSAPLRCDDPDPSDGGASPLADTAADPERQFAQVMACKRKLLEHPPGGAPDALRFFTTPHAMQDLDAVRRHLGAQRINLIGGSYGTRAGLEYLRQFPQAVRRAVLDGVAPPDMVLPASMSMDAQAVLEAMLSACAREAACARDHPRLREEWHQVLAGLPRRVSALHPVSGEPQTFTLTRDALLGAVRGALYSPTLVAALPEAIGQAAQGRHDGLIGLASVLTPRKPSDAPAMGMHFSVVCAEDAPRMRGPAAAAASGVGIDFGDSHARFYQRVCAQWPRGDVPEGFYAVRPAPAPVMLLSGGLDPVTPPRHGERMRQALGANAVHVVVDNAGHGVMSLGCMPDVMFRFIDAVDDTAALGLDTACAKGIPRPPAFQPLRLSKPPAPATTP